MFVDKVKIRVKAGDGGNGCVSFRREKYVDRGGPDGGDGGKGGDVAAAADKNITDLSDYYFQPRLVAKHGVHGRGKNCFGRSAKTIIAKVPIGTQVFRLTAPVKQRAPSSYHPAAAARRTNLLATTGCCCIREVSERLCGVMNLASRGQRLTCEKSGAAIQQVLHPEMMGPSSSCWCNESVGAS